MKRLRTKPQAALNLPTLTLEGGLFLPDQLEKAAQGRASHQTEADYGTPKGIKLKDEYSRAFQIACAQWQHFAAQLDRADVDAASLTTTFVHELLRDAFGYSSLQATTPLTLGERRYPLTLQAGALPVLVAPHTLALDDPDPRFAVIGSGSRRKTAAQAMQELLNASSEHLWGLVTNGKQLRLLRDAATLTRPSYLEVDLADLLGGARYAEFANVWRILHASRGPQATQTASACHWEHWREAGQEEGTRVRDGLREGVTQALLLFGEGFLQHPANEALRTALHDGSLTADAYFQQLLRLIYRLIFVFSVEERGLLHTQGEDTATQKARRAYAEGYALARLRPLSLKRRARTRFDDHWQAIRIVFKGLSEGEPRLALPALGGLFATSQCPALDAASLTNTHLLAAMQNLRWASTGSGAGRTLAPVDYRNMGPEELGSVYESLLELVPSIDLPARRFGFVGLTSEGSTAGNARKLSGSYYTPDSLVQELIKSALDPVIEQRLAANPAQPIAALLAIRVIDPACGSGHFLLAAARRLAEKLAQLRSLESGQEGAVKPQDYRHALREVVARCIYGVDRNPMAIELARTALWLEGFEEGRPLGFLDHHLQVGDALLGLTDLKALEQGIAKDAYKPLSGDDKERCKQLAKTNAAALKSIEKLRTARTFGQLDVTHQPDSGLAALQALEALPEDSTTQIAAKAHAHEAWLQQARSGRLALAANGLLGAYLLPKTADTTKVIPTTATLYLSLQNQPLPAEQQAALAAAQAACEQARVLHWPLAFPQVFAAGGFDCVLGNPPWDMLQLDPQEFFATRAPDVANAKHMAARDKLIAELQESNPRLHTEYWRAVRRTEAAQNFIHASGRFPTSGFGRLNLAYLFTELFLDLRHRDGRSGLIVPTGIATDSFSQHLFNRIANGNLISLFDIENRDAVFPSVHRSYKFCLLTLGNSQQADFVCFASQVSQFADSRRRFKLTPNDFGLLNPNTRTCPIFRSNADAELTKKIYRHVPALWREASDGVDEQNPWALQLMLMFMMNTDSYRFKDATAPDVLPLYEAKLMHQFDHRWATYDANGDSRDLSDAEKNDPAFTVMPRYWVTKAEVEARISDKNQQRGWLMGWRDVCRATDNRTLIATVIPKSAVGDKFPLMMPSCKPQQAAALLGCLNSLVCDFVARQKVGGTAFKFFTMKQIAVLPPSRYTATDLAFIVPRVLELTYTAHDLGPWAQDLGFEGPPFAFNPNRRATLRAELDAYYARLYGLTRDELRYILDPADLLGDDYPSETFRVLKNKEQKEFGEYRTQRLVLAAWDALASGALS